MRIPDDVHRIYVQVYAKFPDLFRSRSDEERREGNRRAIATIRAKRVPNWERWVWKTAHSNGSSPSKDAIGFVPDAPVHEILHRARVRLLLWDMINGNSREVNPPGENQHDVDDQYVVLDGVEPFDYLEDGTQPAPRPQPDPGGTHRYMGGSTDTGTCDECGRSREEGVHRVPEGRTQHKPWQGEDGRGPCDLCFQPIEADIHRSVPVDAQPPNPVLTHSPSPPVLQPHVFQGVTRCDVPKCGRAKSDGIHIKEPADLDPQPDDDARMVRIEQALQRIEAILGRVFRA